MLHQTVLAPLRYTVRGLNRNHKGTWSPTFAFQSPKGPPHHPLPAPLISHRDDMLTLAMSVAQMPTMAATGQCDHQASPCPSGLASEPHSITTHGWATSGGQGSFREINRNQPEP